MTSSGARRRATSDASARACSTSMAQASLSGCAGHQEAPASVAVVSSSTKKHARPVSSATPAGGSWSGPLSGKANASGQTAAETTVATVRTRPRRGTPGSHGAQAAEGGRPAVPAGVHDGAVVIETASPTEELHRLTGWAIRRDVTLSGLTVDRPSLEDVYLRLTRDGAPSGAAGEEPPMTTATLTGPRPRRRNRLGLVIHQVRYEQLSFWRNPQSAVFTFVFPVLFVAIMGALFGGVGKSAYFDGLSALQYYVPTIAALCVLGSCYGQLAVALAARRQNGILKRIRATPLPAWTYFIGLLAHCVLVSLADIVLIVGVGRLYGVPFPSHWLAIALTLVLGAASFCALGVAVASVISNAEAAPAVAQLVLFPLLFLSGTYTADTLLSCSTG